jgi:predicted ATPase/DNA-binding SARP family transcriptional activator
MALQALRLRLLGAPALLHASGAEPLVAERLTQLAVLLAVRGEWTTRDHVAALLWPELGDGAARRNLRKLLFRARREPWLESLQSRPDGLRWRVDCDLREFEAAVADQAWERAALAYRGALGDGLESRAAEPYVEWLRFERNRVAASFRAAAASWLLQLGADAVARERAARHWLSLDPLDEDALAATVEAVAMQGRHREVERTVEQFAERLGREIGVGPSARVRALLGAPRVGAGSSPLAHAGLVGRRAEIREALALLARDECRVLTLTGPGGVGKSRLAQALAAPLRATFDAVRWVRLEDLAASDQVLPRLAAALEVAPSGRTDPFEAIVAGLGALSAPLLVFDNAEHLDGVAAIVGRLTSACDALKVLVTSRARLAVPGEWVLPLGGLASPDVDEVEADAIRAFDAVRLFEVRAQAAAPSFDAGRHASGIAALARMLDGMPLAIELAAPWVRMLSVADIVREIEKSIDLLARDGAAPDRQRSVRASFEHSWRLLSALEQRCLSQLAVFAAPFTREAAEQVADASLPVLAALADKSLLRAQESRFSLHPLVRQCARGAIVDGGEAERRHADYFALRLGHLLDHHVGRPATLEAMDVEIEDVRAAWNHAVRTRDAAATATIAPPLAHYLAIRGRRAEAIALLDHAASAWSSWPDGAHAVILESLGGLLYGHGEVDRAEETLRAAIRLHRAHRRGGATHSILYQLGAIRYTRGDFSAAQRYFEQARRRAEAASEPSGTARALNGLAACARAAGGYALTLDLQRRALALYESVGDVHGEALLLNDIGVMLHTTRRYGEARDTLRRALALTSAHGLDLAREYCLFTLGMTEIELERFDDAREHLRQSLQFDRTAGGGLVAWGCHLGLARADVRTGNASVASAELGEGVRRARALKSAQAQIYALGFVAEWLDARAERDRAAALWTFIASHPRAEAADRDDAGTALDGMRLTSGQRRRAAAAAGALELDTLIDALAAEIAR